MRREFEFEFASSHRLAALMFGVRPTTARAAVTDRELLVRFGPWRLRTPVSNIHGTDVTADYSWLRTAGPAHLSLRDKGVTFATTGRHGLCISFIRPVVALDPLGILRHPAATLTVREPEQLAEAIRSSQASRWGP